MQLVGISKNVILFQTCFSFSCSGYDLALIKKNHTLNYYLFLQKFSLKQNLTNSLLTAEFTAKTTNSEKAIYFLPLMSYSINKLKSQMFIYVEKKVLLRELVGEGEAAAYIGGISEFLGSGRKCQTLDPGRWTQRPESGFHSLESSVQSPQCIDLGIDIFFEKRRQQKRGASILKCCYRCVQRRWGKGFPDENWEGTNRKMWSLAELYQRNWI